MAAVQGLSYNMSSSTAPVSRLAELQSLLKRFKDLKISSTNTQENTQSNSNIQQNITDKNTREHHSKSPPTPRPCSMALAQHLLGSSLQSVVSLDLDTSWAAQSVDTALYYRQKADQARFQQKQLQEKEQKLLALYEEQSQQGYQRFGPGGGKVRQLFQERRGQNHHHSAGWDKSYPLEPITDNKRERGASLDRNLNNVWRQQPVRRTRSQVRRDDELPPSRSYEPLDQLALRYNPVFGDENDYLARVNDLDSSRLFRRLPNIGGAPLSDSTDRFKTYIATKQHPNASMAPAKEAKPPTRITEVGSITKALSRMSPPSKKTEVKPAAQPIGSRSKTTPPASALKQRNSANSRVPVRPVSDPPATPTPQEKEPPKMNKGAPAKRTPTTRSGATTTSGGVSQSRGGTPARGPMGMKAPSGPASGARSDLVPCKTCNRSFAPDRIQAHSEICAKTARKKRKPFDVAKQRVKGTELEQFARKGRSSQAPPTLTKSNWRRKHEEFISNIRAAKQAQQHVAKGGKLSDLPPPPPLDTSDYIQCPHCGRRFNEAAAERHIPKCATMIHNKPKPSAPAKPKTTAQTRR